ncbi:nucleotide sugar dehydrogenase, partial [Candidatus Pelagibacter ubique]|nr:nucleotide sugar dehydrogenase [Candidatus Pelagibacter ubique]
MVQEILSNVIKKNKGLKLAVIGLGYVGLPLALEFAKKRKVIAYDLNQIRINELKASIDKNLETSKKQFKNSNLIKFTSSIKDLKLANFYIITVPTPINKHKKPNLVHLLNSSKAIGKILKKNDIVVYESTVYPGCIEEDCVPVLEKYSKLKFNIDFFCGYSPERINPGDKKHTVANIKKITSGSTPKIANIVDRVYKTIVTVGTYKTSSIKIAEAAKVIENTQRDLNIALINELSIIFNKMNIDTQAVLDAAGSKWNFLPFKPGLVGGHCIGIDPYYLTYKAKIIGYEPRVILAGREINYNMGKYVALNLIKKMKKKKIKIKNSNVLIMGLTFKENCTDIRNSGVERVISVLKKSNCNLDFYDPWADRVEIKNQYGFFPKLKLKKYSYDVILIAVAHNIFKNMKIKFFLDLCKKKHII